MNKEILRRPFPPEQVRQRQGQGGKKLSYVPTFAVVERLNEAFDCEWTFEVVKHEILENEVLVVGRLSAANVVKMAFGGSSVTKDSTGKEVSLADDLKAAASDALKKAASLLGVGLELYGASAVSPSAASVRQAGPTELTARTATPEVGDRLTSRQLSAIHATARRRGIGNGQLQALLVERYGKNEPQYLTKKEASELISELMGPNEAAA